MNQYQIQSNRTIFTLLLTVTHSFSLDIQSPQTQKYLINHFGYLIVFSELQKPSCYRMMSCYLLSVTFHQIFYLPIGCCLIHLQMLIQALFSQGSHWIKAYAFNTTEIRLLYIPVIQTHTFYFIWQIHWSNVHDPLPTPVLHSKPRISRG